MYQRKITPEYSCGILLTKEVLGGKWKPALLYGIASGLQRPSELQRHLPAASRRVLAIQLAELERHGLLGKTIYPELPPRVEYYLTDFGRSLLPVIEAMTQWGDAHRPRLEHAIGVSAATDQVDELGEGFTAQL